MAWYLSGLASWYTGFGMQVILFPWLVTVVLREPAQRVGVAQMALMAPSIAFMLLGGAVADRKDCRRLLVRSHLLAALPPLVLGAFIAQQALTYPLLIVYGLAMGTMSAFVIPARDAILARIVPDHGLAHAVAVSTATQFIFQLCGIVVAGTAGLVGAVALLAAQSVVVAFGAYTVHRLSPAPARGPGTRRAGAVRDGLREALGSSRIRPVIIAMTAIGLLYVGAFMVLLPLIVRDVYGGGAGALALVNICFWGGTIAATLAQVRFGLMQRPGRAMLVAIAGGTIILAAMTIPGPLYGLAFLCLLWGVGAGVTMTQGRTIVQLDAPDSHRARVLALFQLGFMGGAPIGSVLLGYLASLVGARPAALYPAIGMVGVLLYLLTRSSLWQHTAAVPPGRLAATPAPAR